MNKNIVLPRSYITSTYTVKYCMGVRRDQTHSECGYKLVEILHQFQIFFLNSSGDQKSSSPKFEGFLSPNWIEDQKHALYRNLVPYSAGIWY